MKTLRRLLHREIVTSVAFVAAAFLSLFYFIDFVDELNDSGKPGFTLWRAALLAALEMPGHLYELLPISVLIGTIYALSRMAQSSEFTILRTAGLGPGRALGLLAMLGLAFAALTMLVGDYLAPWAERQVAMIQAQGKAPDASGPGAWLKERVDSGGPGERIVAIHIARARGPGELHGIRIFEHDAQARLVQRTQAATGRVDARGLWTLQDVVRDRWPPAGDGSQPVSQQRLATLEWRSSLSADVVAAAVLPPKTMTTVDLWRYSAHLSRQAQDAQRYAIQFWKKALYPLACVVMVALALPFAYLHARAGGVSLKVFGGIMLGISFVLLNNVAGHLGVLRDWTPWVAAATPALLYLLLSLLAFGWLVRYR